jgi:hypothetical protein
MLLNATRILRRAKIILAARYLFSNWLPLLIRYGLNRLGFSVKLEAKIDQCIVELESHTLERLISGFLRGMVKSVECINGGFLVNGVRVRDINEVVDLETWAQILGWRRDMCGCWVKSGVKFKNMYWSILEVFDYGEYSALNVNGRVVVDVGAFIGDSSIYFALRGSKRVIAIEPDSRAYREMLENIKLNRLEDVIYPVNASLVSDHLSKLFDKADSTASVITLSEIINKYCVECDVVLKMDCEGCEHDIIVNDYESVKLFSELIFEYHVDKNRPLSRLLRTLAKNYKCEIILERKYFGIIYCTKKSSARLSYNKQS